MDIDSLLRVHQINDPVIIDTMVEQYRPFLYHMALSILNDPAEADDATQDSFVSAALHLDRYLIGTNFKAWLYSITVNVCRGYLRKRNTQQNIHTLLRTLHLVTFSVVDPEHSILENELRSQLWAVVNRLDEKHRLVVILRIIHDLPISQIAYILDTNEKTIYSRLYTAFSKLRKWAKPPPDFY